MNKRNCINFREKNLILIAKKQYSEKDFKEYVKNSWPQLNPLTYGEKNLTIWDIQVTETIRVGGDMLAKKANYKLFSKEAKEKLAILDPRYKKKFLFNTTPLVSTTSNIPIHPVPQKGYTIADWQKVGVSDDEIIWILKKRGM